MVRAGRPHHVWRKHLPLIVARLLSAAAFPQEPATASSAAPYLEVREPLVLERGASVVIDGRAFLDRCRGHA